jgi:hypothetical protein
MEAVSLEHQDVGFTILPLFLFRETETQNNVKPKSCFAFLIQRNDCFNCLPELCVPLKMGLHVPGMIRPWADKYLGWCVPRRLHLWQNIPIFGDGQSMSREFKTVPDNAQTVRIKQHKNDWKKLEEMPLNIRDAVNKRGTINHLSLGDALS